MGMIFPGMDPYVEDAQLWPGFHHALIVYIRDHLRRLVAPRYVAAIEERVYLEGPEREVIPDAWVRRSIAESRTALGGATHTATALLDEDAPLRFKIRGLEIHEPYVTIIDPHSGQTVVTVIEVVSPANKNAGPGCRSYETKQQELLASDSDLVEIDLLRFGPHVVAVPEYGARGMAGVYDYLICLSRAQNPRDEFEFYPCRVRNKLPCILIPLADDDPDVQLDLQAVLAQTYDAGSFRHRIDYRKPCKPPLPPEDQDWAGKLIDRAGGHTQRVSPPPPSGSFAVRAKLFDALVVSS